MVYAAEVDCSCYRLRAVGHPTDQTKLGFLKTMKCECVLLSVTPAAPSGLPAINVSLLFLLKTSQNRLKLFGNCNNLTGSAIEKAVVRLVLPGKHAVLQLARSQL